MAEDTQSYKNEQMFEDFLKQIKDLADDEHISKMYIILTVLDRIKEEDLKELRESIKKVEEQRDMYKQGFEKLYELLKNILESQNQKSVDYDKRIKLANKILLKLSDKFGYDYEEVDLTKLPSMSPEEKRKLLENLLAIIQSWFSDPFTYKSFWYGIWFGDEDYLNLLISRLRG